MSFDRNQREILEARVGRERNVMTDAAMARAAETRPTAERWGGLAEVRSVKQEHNRPVRSHIADIGEKKDRLTILKAIGFILKGLWAIGFAASVAVMLMMFLTCAAIAFVGMTAVGASLFATITPFVLPAMGYLVASWLVGWIINFFDPKDRHVGNGRVQHDFGN